MGNTHVVSLIPTFTDSRLFMETVKKCHIKRRVLCGCIVCKKSCSVGADPGPDKRVVLAVAGGISIKPCLLIVSATNGLTCYYIGFQKQPCSLHHHHHTLFCKSLQPVLKLAKCSTVFISKTSSSGNQF